MSDDPTSVLCISVLVLARSLVPLTSRDLTARSASLELCRHPVRPCGRTLLAASHEDSDAPAVLSTHPTPVASGGVLVLDKHITHASLHRPLAGWVRRDVVPFVVGLTVLVAVAAPALWWEAQVQWLRSGEVVEEVDAGAAAAAAANITAPVDNSWTLEDDATSADTVNGTKPLSEIELAIRALDVPESLHFYFMYLLPLYLFLSAIAWLVLYWNVKLQIALRYERSGGIEAAENGKATCVRVVPVEHGGKSEICPLQRSILPTGERETYFTFQKTKYILQRSPEGTIVPKGHVDAWFAPLDFPTHDSLGAYLSRANSKSAGSPEVTKELLRKYGENVFDIPLPPFADLFKEHALAPFFVFQIFCVLLWCLDEYWYYSLVTLFMLVMFEATVVKRRLKNLEFLREMRIKPYTVQVYRSGKWTGVLTSDLVPHDLISLVRPTNEQNVVPADILLLTGSVVVNEAMLTGESVPQIKESLESSSDDLAVRLSINKEHKRSMLFGGTKVLMSNPPSKEASEAGATQLNVKNPPDGGCIGYVLRTGFNTSQGKLVRTILFSSETVSINNTESLMFIGVLLVFAIAASVYVCVKGLEDEGRSRYKLMLNSIMIITSVVPPELPMELSLAVNTSLLSLMKNHIFCTEPFRIPVAGAVDVACFDKTGTLSADEFVVKGVVGVPAADGASSSSSAVATSDASLLSTREAVPMATKFIIAGCHSLAFLPESATKESSSSSSSSDSKPERNPFDNLIGDPLEKSSLLFIDWSIGRQDTAVNKHGRERARLLHKYPFSSALKRMSTILSVESEPGSELRVVAKGAPEVMESRFAKESVPREYTRMYSEYAQQGCRVLALGWKPLTGLRDLPDDRRALKSLTRDSVESGLIFAGFLVLQCPLKKDSREVVLSLKQSSHEVMMISGDAALTCCAVAAEVGITTKQTLILQVDDAAPSGLTWQLNSLNSTDSSLRIPFSYDFTSSSLLALTEKYDLCVGGDALEKFVQTVQKRTSEKAVDKSASAIAAAASASTARIALFISHVSIFARTSPDQKELLLHWLKSTGLTTLMCGDGTNDSGALKQAHIGVALISEDAAKAMGKATELAKNKANLRHQAVKAQFQPAPVRTKLQQQLQEQLKKMEEEAALEENTTPRLGDASIAAPFTSKLPFTTSCVDIIRQGRCTLVTTLQMFNILGVNSLLSAYSMSVLYLDGVKWGDTQMTVASLSIAMFFFFNSRAQPLKQLSQERPHKRIFTWGMILSVLGQFAIHMCILITAIRSANPHTPTTEEHKSPKKKFQPNVLNSVVFLVSTTQTVATFAANYRGRPFMESLRENSGLWKALVITFGLMMLLASEAMPELNTYLELHELPSDAFRQELIILLLLDVSVTYFYAKFLRKIFAVRPSAAQLRSAKSVPAAWTTKQAKDARTIEMALKKAQ